MDVLGAGIGLEGFLVLAAVLFSIGLYGLLAKKSLIMILLSIELMGMAVTLNVVAINRWVSPLDMTGWFFALFEVALAAAELGVGLALVIALFRRVHSTELDDFEELEG